MELIELEPWGESYALEIPEKFATKTEDFPKKKARSSTHVSRVSSEKLLPVNDQFKPLVQCKQWVLKCKRLKISSNKFPSRVVQEYAKNVYLRNRQIRNMGNRKYEPTNSIVFHRISQNSAFKRSIEMGINHLNVKHHRKTYSLT